MLIGDHGLFEPGRPLKILPAALRFGGERARDIRVRKRRH
jgi:hypothetical protein